MNRNAIGIPCFVFASLVAGLAACASREGSVQDVPRSMRLARDSAEIEMRIVHDVPVVEAHIGSAGPFRFVIDTGSSVAVVSRETARDAELRPARGSGDDLVHPAGVRIPELSLGDDVALLDFDAVVRLLDDWSEVLGEPVDGVIGASLLRGGRFRFDYGRRRIRIDRGAGEAPDGRRVFRVSSTAGRPTITVALEAWLLSPVIDTGSSARIVLADAEEERLEFLERAAPREVPGTTAARGFALREARVDGTLRFGEFTIEDPHVEFGRSTLLGGAFLRDWIVTFDLRPDVRSLRFDPDH